MEEAGEKAAKEAMPKPMQKPMQEPMLESLPLLRLDLRGVACPMNFVKTRLKLDKMASGELLEVLLDSGEPIESVSSSVLSEGHLIESSTLISPLGEAQMLTNEQLDYHRLIIRKTNAA